MNINPFIDLFSNIIGLYNFAIFVWIILFWLIRFDIVNPYQPIVSKIMQFLDQMIEPALRYIRKFIPSFGSIDLSPLILILLLQFIDNAIYTYLYQH